MKMNLSQEEANNREADAVEAECCLLAAASLVIRDAEDERGAKARSVWVMEWLLKRSDYRLFFSKTTEQDDVRR